MLNQSAALDMAFQALADPTRRAMLERLSNGPASVSELAKPLSMSLPAVMQHLAILEQVRLGGVQEGRDGSERARSSHGADRSEAWINARRLEWQRRFDRLKDYLEEMKNQGGQYE